MKTNKLTTARINRIREQGYTCHTENQINGLAFGNRFAYRACVSILIAGVALANIPILSGMMAIAFFGVVLPYHPFDYFYNHVLSKRMNNDETINWSNWSDISYWIVCRNRYWFR